VLADHARAVRRDLGPREADALHARDLGEEGVVAAGRLRAALDHVARGHRAGQGPGESKGEKRDDLLVVEGLVKHFPSRPPRMGKCFTKAFNSTRVPFAI